MSKAWSFLIFVVGRNENFEVRRGGAVVDEGRKFRSECGGQNQNGRWNQSETASKLAGKVPVEGCRDRILWGVKLKTLS